MSLINVGYDASGNGNNWTPNNLDYDTTSTGTDVMVDVPTNWGTDTGVGGEVRGNYATLNPLQCGHTGNMSNGNLQYTTLSNNSGAAGTIDIPIGEKIYIESNFNHPINSGEIFFLGIANQITISGYLTASRGGCLSSPGSSFYGIGVENQTTVLYVYKSENGVGTTIDTSYPLASSSVVGIAVDRVANDIELFIDGVSVQTLSIPSSGTLVPYISNAGGSGLTTCFQNVNFGQRPFAYSAPSGFKALCTQNLPEPTVVDGGEYFDVSLYTGNGTGLSVTNSGFQPDLVWIKDRSQVVTHVLTDSVRGTTKQLFSNLTNLEQTNSTYVTSFDSSGFTVGVGTSGTGAVNNTTPDAFVGWQWKANGAGVSNTDGTITSTVSANTTAGFSIVTYTGNGTSNSTVGHGLGAAPSMVIIKNRSSSFSWAVLHTSAGLTGSTLDGSPEYKMLTLNSNMEATDFGDDVIWNPTSTTFKIAPTGGGNWVNANGSNYVAYCFAPVESYSAFGSYVGNGSTDGPFVYTGFRPRWVMIKGASGGYDTSVWQWVIYDTERDPYNLTSHQLRANLSNAELNDTIYNKIDFVSNGFKNRSANYGELNGSGNTYIYAAFAENPFKYALAR